MKSIFSFIRLLWIGVTLSLLSGCISPMYTPTQVLTITLGPTESPVPLSTQPNPLTPLPTPIVTELSPEATQTIVDTSTISPPAPSVTLAPTLNANERQNTFIELLRTNAGCKLPCWWGVVPGKTTWSQTEQLLSHMGVKIFSFPMSDGAILKSPGDFYFEDEVHNDFGFFVQNDIVESIHIRGEGYSNSTGFQSAWEQYSPFQVMNDYGPPDRVWMYSDAVNLGTSGKSPYSLWIAYDNLGFLIRYDGSVERKPIYHVCPRFDHGQDIQELALFLQSSDNPRLVEEMDSYYPHVVQYIHSLKDATGLTVDEFYQLFTQDKKPACFDTPKNIWPSSFP
jgi:hypothetical protein